MQNVSFGSSGTQKRSIFSDIKNSAINVGTTALVGGTIGAIGGKIGTLVPYKPSEAAINFQYADMFEKATNANKIPECLKDTGDDIKNLISKGQKIKSKSNTIKNYYNKLVEFVGNLSKVKPNEYNSDEIQTQIKNFFKDSAKNIPEGGYNQANVVQKIESKTDKINKILTSQSKKFSEYQEKFVDIIKNLKNENLESIAKKGAKHLRNRAIIGTGIAIGVVGALIFNILNTYGLIGRKAQASAPPTNQNPPQAQPDNNAALNKGA